MEIMLLLQTDLFQNVEVAMDGFVVLLFSLERFCLLTKCLLYFQDETSIIIVHAQDCLIETDCASSVHGASCTETSLLTDHAVDTL